VHRLQGEAEGVSVVTQLSLLQDVYREKLALFNRHVEGATRIANYESNNTYQYVIARDEQHVQWLRDAVVDLEGPIPTDIKGHPVPSIGKEPESERAIADDDAKLSQAYYERWKARLEDIRNARHKKMVELMLGEILEQRRFFEQAAEGRDDLLGRRMPGAGTGDGVMAVRWLE
jgi:hypothetical protein